MVAYFFTRVGVWDKRLGEEWRKIGDLGEKRVARSPLYRECTVGSTVTVHVLV